MIKEKLLKKYYPAVESALVQAFECAIKNQKNPGDFLLFLENGHKRDFPADDISEYMIGFGLRGVADSDRREFIDFYYRHFNYTQIEKKVKDKADKDYLYKNFLHFDLMIYAHSWESYPNLARVKQLANLVTSLPYDWSIQMPDYTKHDWIRKDIRDVFKTEKLKIAEIMTKAFHSQLRNAFAHSDYNFFKTGFITLTNYKGDDSWEMKEISYADWDERFTLTVQFFNVFSKLIDHYKRKLGAACPKEGYPVWMPTKTGEKKLDHLWYEPHYNRFLWPYQRTKEDG